MLAMAQQCGSEAINQYRKDGSSQTEAVPISKLHASPAGWIVTQRLTTHIEITFLG